jgi:zinc protease
MPDRKTAPPFKTIDRIDVIKARHDKLSNGVDLYSITAGSQEIVKLEFIFRAGMYYQPATLVASGTNNLIETGTKRYNAQQISEGIDFYGSFLELQVEQDFATVTVYTLNKYLKETLAYIEEIIKYPVFPEDEFQIYIANKKQKHLINSQKVSVLARRKFSRQLFGSNHPYGVDVTDSDFSRITVSEVRDFFSRYYRPGNCTILASGYLPATLPETLDGFFGSAWPDSRQEKAVEVKESAPEPRHLFIERPEAVQSAIRIGRLLFNKTHPDYCKFQVLNTIFGGYFGSRLMANIREDKGYTYGIGSGVNNLVHGGYFFVSTEVGAQVTNAAIKEIYSEMRKMREELVDSNELETVRNYILGHFLRSVDGPFALAEKFRAIWEYGLDYSFYDRYFADVKSVTPQELRDLANRYLAEDDMMQCVVGKMDA